MTTSTKKMMGGRLFFFWVVAGFCEATAFYWGLVEGRGSVILLKAFVMHLLASLSYFLAEPKGGGWIEGGRYWSKTGSTLIFFLPVFGWIVLPVLYSIKESSSDYASGTDKDQDAEDFMLVPKPYLLSTSGAPWRERVMRELDFMPLADILVGHDEELKRGAIERLGTLKTPESIGLLMSHRSDPSPEVRFFVISTLSRVKKDFDEQVDAAKLEMQKNVYKVSARVFLAKTYLQYVRSGLLDATTKDAFENEVIYHLEYAAKTDYARSEVFEMLASIRADRQEWPLAFAVLEKFDTKEGGLELIRHKIEVLFSAGRYGEMTSLLFPLRDDKNVSAPLQALARWWGSS